jgi:hypothetical protein
MKNILNSIFRISIGLVLILLGICSAIFSTYATIIPISMSFKEVTKSIMIGIFIIVQVSVFFLAMTKNYIARETPQHYVLISRIANILLIVSIVSTITFFTLNKHSVIEHQKSVVDLYKVVPFMDKLPFYDWVLGITVNFIFIWAICIILDLLAIKMPIIGFDVIMGIKEKQTVTTTLSKICAIIADKPKRWIDTRYNSLGLEESNQESEKEKIFIKVFEQQQEEVEQIEAKEVMQIEEPKEEKLFEKKVLNLENIEKVFEYIINNLKPGNVSQGIKKIADNTNMSTSEVIRIREQLVKFGYLQSDKEKMQTLVIKEKLNLKDFEEDNDNE